MRLKTLLLMSLIFPLIGFYSCRESKRGDEKQILPPEEKTLKQDSIKEQVSTARDTAVVQDSTVRQNTSRDSLKKTGGQSAVDQNQKMEQDQ